MTASDRTPIRISDSDSQSGIQRTYGRTDGLTEMPLTQVPIPLFRNAHARQGQMNRRMTTDRPWGDWLAGEASA